MVPQGQQAQAGKGRGAQVQRLLEIHPRGGRGRLEVAASSNPTKSADKPAADKTTSALAANTQQGNSAKGGGGNSSNSDKSGKDKGDKKKKNRLPKGSDCPLCSKHGKTKIVAYCPEWRKLNVNQKWKHVKDLKLCVGCLGDDGHVMANCTRKTVCGIDGCTLSHRRELHTKPSGNDAGGSNKQQK